MFANLKLARELVDTRGNPTLREIRAEEEALKAEKKEIKRELEEERKEKERNRRLVVTRKSDTGKLGIDRLRDKHGNENFMKRGSKKAEDGKRAGRSNDGRTERGETRRDESVYDERIQDEPIYDEPRQDGGSRRGASPAPSTRPPRQSERGASPAPSVLTVRRSERGASPAPSTRPSRKSETHRDALPSGQSDRPSRKSAAPQDGSQRGSNPSRLEKPSNNMKPQIDPDAEKRKKEFDEELRRQDRFQLDPNERYAGYAASEAPSVTSSKVSNPVSKGKNREIIEAMYQTPQSSRIPNSARDSQPGEDPEKRKKHSSKKPESSSTIKESEASEKRKKHRSSEKTELVSRSKGSRTSSEKPKKSSRSQTSASEASSTTRSSRSGTSRDDRRSHHDEFDSGSETETEKKSRHRRSHRSSQKSEPAYSDDSDDFPTNASQREDLDSVPASRVFHGQRDFCQAICGLLINNFDLEYAVQTESIHIATAALSTAAINGAIPGATAHSTATPKQEEQYTMDAQRTSYSRSELHELELEVHLGSE
ncbi:hypothetical protein BPAE_0165g00080 [Botrytis paeoniae]|uniref:Uncharacterized protein n=1 Tax=Botrytis paeoniae TaxID=278948 RepID=A0A4Z1FCC6_9HELO|nr:hypothetical protein BPAE_0165g00080 [Botrytis paeoniae]